MKIMKDKVFQKDFYCVYNDYNVSLRTTELNLLYLPLVGSDAVKLYQKNDWRYKFIKELFTL